MARLSELFWLLAFATAAVPVSAGEVRVFAAASLTRALRDAQRQLAGTLDLQVNSAGSQQLALQLTEGARADVFASADERWMNDVDGKGLLAGKAAVFARNLLVVITPKANPARIEDLGDLARPGIKLVLAADAVPAGRYSRETLAGLEKRGGLGDGYEKRVLANVVSEEENVQAVVAKVQLGEADAGIVYASDTGGDRRDALRAIEIPLSVNVEARYPVAVLKDAQNPSDARVFIDWLLSPSGQELLVRHGFLAAAP